MNDFLRALRFLTRLPVPAAGGGGGGGGGGGLSQALRWFPLVGLLVGAILLAAAAAGRLLGPGVGAAAALVAWVWVTGALHLDGIGDIADALGGGHAHGPARVREILHDPHIGSFGVVAIALLLLAKFALLQALLATGPAWPLLLVPALARMLPMWWAQQLPPRHPGLGSQLGGGVGRRFALLWAIVFCLLLVVLPAAAILLLFAPAWGWWVRRRLGGISGDSHGAGIELAEALLLLAMVAVRALS